VAIHVARLELRYLVAFIGAVMVLFVCLMIRERNRLFYFFLVLFVMGIPFNLDLHLFYRKFHLGGAMGIDLSLSFISAVVLYAILLYERYTNPDISRIHYNKTLMWTQILFMVAGLVSLVNAEDAVLVFYEMVKLTVLFFFSLLMMNLKDERQLRTVLFFLSAGVVAQALLALYQYKTGRSLGLKVFGEQALVQQYLGYMTSRATGTIGHPNILAYYFEILLPLLFALFLVEERKLVQSWYFLAVVMGVLGLLITLSRAGWITVPISFTLVFVSLLKDRWHHWRTIFQIFLGALCLIVFFYFFFPTIEKRYTFEDRGAASQRMPLNRAAMSIISQFPVFGVGLNNLGEVYRRYDTTGAATRIRGPAPHIVHNLYLAVWADVGTVGFAAFVVFLVSIFVVALRLLSHVSRWRQGVLIGILAGILAHLAHGFVDPGFRSTLNMSYLIYVLVGLIGAIGAIPKQETLTGSLENNNRLSSSPSERLGSVSMGPRFA
jgi:O-antigen ligase